MSPHLYEFASQATSLVWKSVSISAGAAILLSSGNALALSLSQEQASSFKQPQLIQLAAEPDDSSAESEEDVVVDTEPDNSDSTTTNPDSDTTANQPRFSCQFVNGQYTVMYQPKSQPNQSYAWATPSQLGGGWTPERRCNEISRRLESYRPDRLLEMQASVENGYNVVCVTTQAKADCRIVLTVPPGQDPQSTRDRVFQNISTADSGQVTEGVNTFLGGRDAQILNDLLNIGTSSIDGFKTPRRSQNINLRPFLDRADGGNATQLRRGVPTRNRPNPRRLNPNNF